MTHRRNRDPRRRFTAAQARQIAARTGNVCWQCRTPLTVGFHVHHLIAWSEGGPTDITNGIALCSLCHNLWHHKKE